MANLPERPNIDPTQYSQACQAALLLWSDWSDDAEQKFDRVNDRVQRLQDRRDEMLINMQQLSDQITGLNDTVTARDSTITILLAARATLEQQAFDQTVQIRALEAELEALRNP